MSYPIDPSQDYLIAEEPQTITYYYQITEGGFNPQSGVKVDWVEGFEIDRTTALTDPDLWRHGRVFQIYSVPWYAAGLIDPPKRKDRLIDHEGVAWRIEQVGVLSLGTRFRITCSQEVK